MTFNDPRDAVTAALNEKKLWRKEVPAIKYELVSPQGIFIFEESSGKKLKAWSYFEWKKLPKCPCGKILSKDLAKSKAHPKLNFCGTLCATQDDIKHPLNDNDETEFEI